ncbi:MAG: hypothetical protein QOH49_1162 [Acidobacteriota bacterium]|jgi:hypothetical protein|nr:hypothetical protein [Acidobacteriota bacterium]
MRLRTLLTFAALVVVLTCSLALAQEEQQPQHDAQVIDNFVLTRGVSFEEPGKKKQQQGSPSRPPRGNNSSSGSSGGIASTKPPRKLKQIKGGTSIKSGTGGGSEVAAMSADESDVQFVKAGGALRSLALGYTILMKDETGRLYVADATREFKTGDRFAVALETNADGYLYLFSAENGRDPELLFPNAQIDGGANAVQAHARATFPTGASADVEYFIDLTDPPATEHLFIVFSRRPLADVPAGEALVKFCGKNLEDCAWKPTTAQWARIFDGSKGRGVTEAKNVQLAQTTVPTVMPGTLQRGLKVKKDDPKPAIVRVNDSPDADVLVTEIVLTHK